MPNDSSDGGFIYAFKVEKVYPFFPRLPEETQSSIERNIVNVIYDSFVIPADEDYLMARLLAQKGLHRGFFWAASQSLEKYLKAFLLMHDHGVKEFSKSHQLNPLLNAATTLDSDIVNASLSLHPDVKIAPDVLTHVRVFKVTEYIDDISKHGAATNRYNASGVSFNTGHLFALDAFVYQIRKRIGVPRIEESFRRVSKDLIATFHQNNHHFAPSSVIHSDIPSPKFPIKLSQSVTHLDYLKKNCHQQICSIALKWLVQKMKL